MLNYLSSFSIFGI